jgi:hypothetical protein
MPRVIQSRGIYLEITRYMQARKKTAPRFAKRWRRVAGLYPPEPTLTVMPYVLLPGTLIVLIGLTPFG